MVEWGNREQLLREQVALKLCGWTSSPAVSMADLGDMSQEFLAHADELIGMAREKVSVSAIAARLQHVVSAVAPAGAVDLDRDTSLRRWTADLVDMVRVSDRRRPR